MSSGAELARNTEILFAGPSSRLMAGVVVWRAPAGPVLLASSSGHSAGWSDASLQQFEMKGSNEAVQQ